MAITARNEVVYRVSSPHCSIKYSLVTIFEQDGKEVSRKEDAYYKMPGDDLSDAPPEIQQLASVMWTDEVVAGYQAYLADYYGEAV